MNGLVPNRSTNGQLVATHSTAGRHLAHSCPESHWFVSVNSFLGVFALFLIVVSCTFRILLRFLLGLGLFVSLRHSFTHRLQVMGLTEGALVDH